ATGPSRDTGTRARGSASVRRSPSPAASARDRGDRCGARRETSRTTHWALSEYRDAGAAGLRLEDKGGCTRCPRRAAERSAVAAGCIEGSHGSSGRGRDREIGSRRRCAWREGESITPAKAPDRDNRRDGERTGGTL